MGLPTSSQPPPPPASIPLPTPDHLHPRLSDFQRRPPPGPQSFVMEMVLGVLLLVYVVNIFIGKRRNEHVAVTWARDYCEEGEVFDRNFALVGPDIDNQQSGQVMLMDALNVFTCYASGRRHCESMTVTLKLKPRQDILYVLYDIIYPQTDLVHVEVVLPESAPSNVFAVLARRMGGHMAQEWPELERFCKRIEVARERLKEWPREDTVVYAESSAVFYDFVSDFLVNQIFGSKAWAVVQPAFRYMLYSTDHGPSQKDKVLLLGIAMSPPVPQEAVARLTHLIPSLIDLAGHLQLGPEQKSRAASLRLQLGEQETKQQRKEREEALQQRRMQKLAAEKERVAKLGPEALRKWEERQSKIHQRRATKMKVMRS